MKILILLALLPCTQCLAQTPQTPSAATPAAISMTTAAAPANVAAFLATLSGDPGNGPIARSSR
jgi:hypothetical protein